MINAIELYHRHRIKIFFIKKTIDLFFFVFPKEHVRTLNSKKLK